MDFNASSQLEDMEQSPLCMDNISSNVTMATVTISPQDIQAMTEAGSGTVRYETENNSHQVMNLYLQTDAASDFQHITSLAEQQGISIMQPPAQQGLVMGAETEDGEEGEQVLAVIKHEDSTAHSTGDAGEPVEDAASLLAKLQANNPHKTNLVQLTSDGKIIKRLEVERPVPSEASHETSTTNVKAGGLLQQITLADGTTAYISHPTPTDTIQGVVDTIQAVEQNNTQVIQGQAVQLADGTIAYVPRDVLQHSTFTATVNLNLEAAEQNQVEDVSTVKEECAPTSNTWISQLDKNVGVSEREEKKAAESAQQIPVSSDNERTVQVSVTGGQQKTIRVQLAEEGAHSLGIDDKIYKCLFEGCNKIYTSHHHLKVHQRSHTGDKPYICDDVNCQKAFATAYGLKSHKRTHTGEKPYKCGADGCTKAFKTSGDLQKHTRTHTGEKPFVCPFEGCNKRFTTSNIRKVHIRVHTGERPFQCPVAECSKKFSSATNYKNHIRIHTGERPYVCTVPGCGKRFTEYSSLYKHHVVHTHTKPYVCTHCGKTYRQTSTLAMHKRQAHNDETPLSDLELSFVIQSQHPPPDPKRNYIPETEVGEGALVINTSDSQPSQSTDTTSSLHNEISASESQETRVCNTGTTHASTIVSATTQSRTTVSHTNKPNISIVVPANQAAANMPNQQVFIITDPAQTQAVLQHIAGQELDLQHVSLENVSTSHTDYTASTST